MISVNDRMCVTLKDDCTFTGTVKGIQGCTYVVKFDQREIETRRNSNFDPEGCLVVHMDFCTKLEQP